MNFNNVISADSLTMKPNEPHNWMSNVFFSIILILVSRWHSFGSVSLMSPCMHSINHRNPGQIIFKLDFFRLIIIEKTRKLIRQENSCLSACRQHTACAHTLTLAYVWWPSNCKHFLLFIGLNDLTTEIWMWVFSFSSVCLMVD